MLKVKVTDLATQALGQGRQVWLAGLGAVSMAEEQTTKVFSDLVAKGEKTNGGSVAKANKAVTSKTKSIYGKVDGMVEETANRVVSRLGIPTREEILNLTKSVEQLTEKVGAVQAK